MIANPKKLYGGILLMAAFAAVLVALFLPIVDGLNAMEYLDSLYNSISKGSAYHINEIKQEVAAHESRPLDLTLAMESEELSAKAAAIMRKSGAEVEAAGASLMMKGDLAGILTGCLDDADDMFLNDAGRIEAEYGLGGKEALFHWWKALKAMDKALKNEGRFADSKITNTVIDKGLECAYNYYGIEPMRISEKVGIVIISLAFYVLYTIWYGYAIILIFEGCGLRLSH
jgi:hypothetical protein